MIKWFKDIQEDDVQLVGGKGYNLSRMYNEGIVVPNGFVMTSEVYDAYVTTNNLFEIIEGLLTSALPLESQSEAIKKLFVVEKLSPELIDVVNEAFGQVASGRVAVRSSSTVEDLPGLSFAGQYSTFLNVREADLHEKVIECWKSLWHVRAIDYRKKHQVTTEFSHAVVVQEMVDSAISGVAFTANPMNGLRHQLVLNGSWGLGEAIVSGEVSPDQTIVNRDNGSVVESKISKKTMKYIYALQGIERVVINSDEGKKSCLTSDHISKLLKATDQVEAYFGQPQDIEFAFDDKGELFILQSRDITTLFPIDQLEQDGKLRAYMSAGTVLLGMKEPFTNLGFDLMSQMFPTIINLMTNRKKKPLTSNFVRYAGNRMFVDMTYLLANKFVSKQFAKGFSGNDLPLEGVMNNLIRDYGKIMSHQGVHFRLPLGFVGYGLNIAGDMLKISKIPRANRYAAIRAEGDRWYADVLKVSQQATTIEERLDFAVEALVRAFKLSQVQSAYCFDVNNYIKIEKVLRKYFGTKYKVETLVQSLPGCFTQTMTVKLNEYAKYCTEKGIKPSLEDSEFIKILDVYGHRANIELDFGTRRWREDPSYLIGLVESYMIGRMYQRNLEDHVNKRIEAEQMMKDVVKGLASKIGKKKARKFGTYMINYRYGVAMREYPKSDIVRFMALGRKKVLTIGDELVDSGELVDREDIFFLFKAQILEGKHLRELVATNKASYDKEMKRTTIPRMLLNNGHTYYTATTIDPNSKVLQGLALSAGSYEGTIRVVFDPRGTELKEGEVMVTESTNPAWTPLFATAGALIMEYGGPMSHGGIVAREYGIPAVVGIPSATESLKDGQRVRVNGESGTVELLD